MRREEELALRLPRGWVCVRPSLGRVRGWFEKTPGLPGLWETPTRLAEYLSGASAVVETAWGVFYVEGLEVGWRAEVHGIFWGAGVARADGEIREFAEAMRRAWRLRRLEVPVVGRARGVERLLRRVGFELEGVHPLASRSRTGVVQDLRIYGIIWNGEGG